MALFKGACLLRRSYIDVLQARGNLVVERHPTGVLVVKRCTSIGIATYERGKKYPWTTKRRRLPVGSILDPRLVSVFRPETIELFNILGEVNPPNTILHPYGRGFLIEAYMSVDDWHALNRMQRYILGERGYGIESNSYGELRELYTLIDQLELLIDQLRFWNGMSQNERNVLDVNIVALASILERKVDPDKVRAHDQLHEGIHDRLQRQNVQIVRARNRTAHKHISSRIHAIESIKAPVIQRRLAFVEMMTNRCTRVRRTTVSNLSSKIIVVQRCISNGSHFKIGNFSQSLANIADEITREFPMRPWRRRARMAANQLRKASEHALLLQWEECRRSLVIARSLMQNMLFQDAPS